jgi:hypothetical protein
MTQGTSEASLGPPRWGGWLRAGLVAVGCWFCSGPSLASGGRGGAARLCACQDGLSRRGRRSGLRRWRSTMSSTRTCGWTSSVWIGSTSTRWRASVRTTARSISCARIWPGKPPADVPVWLRSWWPGVRAGLHRDQTHRADIGGVILLRRVSAAGDLLLLLRLGR